MTKHNLREHLTWLIVKGPLQPPQPTFTPPSTEASNVSETVLEDSSSVVAPTGPESFLTGAQTAVNDVLSEDPEPEFARPLLPASVLNSNGVDTMARLQSGPKSSHKPRLLSEPIPLSLQTPSASLARAQGPSLGDNYNAQWGQKRSGTLPYVSRIVWNSTDTFKRLDRQPTIHLQARVAQRRYPP